MSSGGRAWVAAAAVWSAAVIMLCACARESHAPTFEQVVRTHAAYRTLQADMEVKGKSPSLVHLTVDSKSGMRVDTEGESTVVVNAHYMRFRVNHDIDPKVFEISVPAGYGQAPMPPISSLRSQ